MVLASGALGVRCCQVQFGCRIMVRRVAALVHGASQLQAAPTLHTQSPPYPASAFTNFFFKGDLCNNNKKKLFPSQLQSSIIQTAAALSSQNTSLQFGLSGRARRKDASSAGRSGAGVESPVPRKTDPTRESRYVNCVPEVRLTVLLSPPDR